MTLEEALTELKGESEFIRKQGETYFPCAMDVAIKALEKQIPKKPWRQADDDTCVYYHYECPSCDHTFGYTRSTSYKFCPSCGQAIDWSDEE